MGKTQQIMRLLKKQKSTAEGKPPLTRRLLNHWGAYKLSGKSKVGLAMFVFRSAREVKHALNDESSQE